MQSEELYQRNRNALLALVCKHRVQTRTVKRRRTEFDRAKATGSLVIYKCIKCEKVIEKYELIHSFDRIRGRQCAVTSWCSNPAMKLVDGNHLCDEHYKTVLALGLLNE